MKFSGQVNIESVAAVEIELFTAMLSQVENIVLEIDSLGGRVDSGLELADTLKQFKDASPQLTCVVDGQAASMAFVIFEACPTRFITPGSTLVGHEPFVTAMFFVGNRHDLRKLSDQLTDTSLKLAKIITERSKMSVEEYLRRIEYENIVFLWTDAIEQGMADGAVVSADILLQ